MFLKNTKTHFTIHGLSTLLGLSIMSVSPLALPAKAAVEEIPFKVIQKDKNFELRQYSSYLMAETEVKSSFDDAGNRAFRALFRYIDGNNIAPSRQQEKIAMTAPVIQKEKIAMTAPVMQSRSTTQSTYKVAFVLPQKYTMDSAPTPKNPKVTIRQVPEKLMAALVYSGWWSQDNYTKHKEELYQKLKTIGYQVIDEPIYARYNDPFTLWFLRRNEIIVEVQKKI